MKIYNRNKDFKNIPLYILISLITFTFSGCKKFVDVPPPDNMVTQGNVYADDVTSAAVLSNLYGDMSSLSTNISLYTGLSGDEFDLWPQADNHYQAYYTNNLSSNISLNTGQDIWNQIYPYIFTCNSAIEGITKSQTLTPSVKKQLLGEAFFLRGFFYSYLTQLYGDVPLAVTTDPQKNRALTRSPQRDVYKQIIEDLEHAANLLSEIYLTGALRPYTTGTPERVRPTKWAALTILARIYLISGAFSQAESTASIVLQQTSIYGLEALDKVFQKNSKEAIWQLQPTFTGNTSEAITFHLSSLPAGLSEDKPVHLSANLLTTFEAGDERYNQWVDSFYSGSQWLYFPAKYKLGMYDPTITDPSMMTEYSMVIRFAEVYAIRAEASARLGNIEAAKSDINVLRQRANLAPVTTTDQQLLLDAINKEKQIEFFTEWGHRWFDLQRSGNINTIMPAVTLAKGGIWKTTDQLYPIPWRDIQNNPALTQNQGY